ncbi:hypothetical protein D3C76_1650100 [compost metagenome]
MVGIVMLFAYQHSRYANQLLDQLFRADDLAAGQIVDLPQLCAVTPLATLPGG